MIGDDELKHRQRAMERDEDRAARERTERDEAEVMRRALEPRGSATPTVALDLDDLERKARVATPGEWAADRVPGMPRDDEPIMANVISLDLDDTGRQQQIADCYDNTRCPDKQCEANAAHIAAASPEVVLALVSRVRLLQRTVGQAATLLEAKSDRAARIEWAKRIRVYVGEGSEAAVRADGDALERIAKAAIAFVDAQGAYVSIERGHTIARAEDFASGQWPELVAAVEAGR